MALVAALQHLSVSALIAGAQAAHGTLGACICTLWQQSELYLHGVSYSQHYYHRGSACAWLSRLNTLALDGLEQWEAIQGAPWRLSSRTMGGLQRLTLSFQELKGSQLKLLAQLPCRLDLDVSAICPLEFGAHTLAGLVSLVAYRWGDFVHGPGWPGWNSLGFSRCAALG